MKFSPRHLFFAAYSLLAISMIIAVMFLPRQFFDLITFDCLYSRYNVPISLVQFTVSTEKVLQAVVSDELGGDLKRNRSSYTTVTVSLILFTFLSPPLTSAVISVFILSAAGGL